MIVVAIIGILAAIGRAGLSGLHHSSQGFRRPAAASAAKMHVSESYQANLRVGHHQRHCVPRSPTSARTKYVSSVAIEAGGVVVATFQRTAATACRHAIDGKKLVLTPSVQGQPLTSALNWNPGVGLYLDDERHGHRPQSVSSHRT